MKRVYIPFILFASIVFAACNGGNSNKGSIPVDNFSNGKAGEVILVMKSTIFSDTLKGEVAKILEQPQPAINQIEPMFDILYFEPEEFTSNFLRHRNIIHFDYNPNWGQNSILIENNSWSSPQIYIKIQGNQPDSMVNLFIKQKEEIMEKLYQNDLKRLIVYNSNNGNPEIEEKIKQKFGISLSVPYLYKIAREEENFLWLLYRTNKNDRFVMIYKTPATELIEDSIMTMRNRMTRLYIPGAVKNAYPIISKIEGFPLITPIQIGYKNGIEMRGFWECVGDKMGGPFYNFSFIDASNNCITIDGFVYAPQETKRDYLREVEAIVKSVR